jgi:hypothetical protein
MSAARQLEDAIGRLQQADVLRHEALKLAAEALRSEEINKAIASGMYDKQGLSKLVKALRDKEIDRAAKSGMYDDLVVDLKRRPQKRGLSK